MLNGSIVSYNINSPDYNYLQLEKLAISAALPVKATHPASGCCGSPL